MSDTTTDLGEVAGTIIAERKDSYLDKDLPAEVHERFADFVVGVSGQLGAAAQLESDLRDLNAKADLVPAHGLARLRNEATGQATAAHERGVRQAQEAAAGIRAALAEAALPTLKPEREAPARQELALLLGNASGPRAQKAVTAIVQNASPEVIACLLSPFGKSLLATRGVSGRDYDETIGYAKTLTVKLAATKGETARERKAAALHEQVAQLEAAIGGAGTHFQTKLRPARQAAALANSHMTS